MSDMPKKEGRSLPWFRVDNDFAAHPKTYALCEELGDPNAGMYVIRLWTHTMRYAARGRLGDGARTALERACEWRGQSGELVAALLKTGWLVETENGAEVHDWDEHQGAAVAKAQKDADRKRDERKRRADGAETARRRRGDAAGNGTERNGTKKQEPAPRDSDALVSDFQAVIGSKYSWQGAKDGEAFAKLRKAYDLEEIRKRWRKGLLASGYASCRTVAELAMKFNHLAGEAAPLQPKLRQL